MKPLPLDKELNKLQSSIAAFKDLAKALNDPVFFARKYCGIELWPKQAEIIREFYGGNHKYLIIGAGKRSGKSALASVIACFELFKLLTLRDPSKYYGILPGDFIIISVIATSEKQADRSLFSKVKGLILSNWDKWRPFKLEITSDFIYTNEKFVGIEKLTSWTTTGEGRNLKTTVIDEIDSFEQTRGRRGAWEIWEMATTSTAQFSDDGKCIAISRPVRSDGVILSLYKWAQKEPKALAYLLPSWEMNPNLTEEELRQQYSYNLNVFYEMFACRPTKKGTQLFPLGIKFDTNLRNVCEQPRRDDKIRVMAIDPAVTRDAFAIAVGWKDMAGHIYIDGLYRFVPQGKPLDADFIKSKIETFINNLNVHTVIFDVWIWPELYQHLEKKFGITLIKHIVTKEDYDLWYDLQEENRLHIVHSEILREECENLVVKVLPSGKAKVDHSERTSKDLADCVANLIWYFNSNEYETPNISIPIVEVI